MATHESSGAHLGQIFKNVALIRMIGIIRMIMILRMIRMITMMVGELPPMALGASQAPRGRNSMFLA